MKSKRLWLMVVIVLLALTALTISCNTAADPQNVKTSATTKIVDYGNGVYYFPHISHNFGNALSAFIKENPTLELVSMASDNTGLQGFTNGYFVVFRSIRQ